MCRTRMRAPSESQTVAPSGVSPSDPRRRRRRGSGAARRGCGKLRRQVEQRALVGPRVEPGCWRAVSMGTSKAVERPGVSWNTAAYASAVTRPPTHPQKPTGPTSVGRQWVERNGVPASRRPETHPGWPAAVLRYQTAAAARSPRVPRRPWTTPQASPGQAPCRRATPGGRERDPVSASPATQAARRGRSVGQDGMGRADIQREGCADLVSSERAAAYGACSAKAVASGTVVATGSPMRGPSPK